MHGAAFFLRGGAEEKFRGGRGGAGSKIFGAGWGNSQTRGEGGAVLKIFGAGAAIFAGTGAGRGVHP